MKNLVLSSWGDESMLSENYVNPHYTFDCYQSYSERTNQNLVSLCSEQLHCTFLNMFQFWLKIFRWNSETLKRRCHWFWSAGRFDMLYRWELPPMRCSSFSSCKFKALCQLNALLSNAYISHHLSLMVLQGVAEIEMLIDRLSASVRFKGASSDWILPLHSMLSPTDQRKVFQSPSENIRKVSTLSL